MFVVKLDVQITEKIYKLKELGCISQTNQVQMLKWKKSVVLAKLNFY